MGHFPLFTPILSCGRGGMADAPDLGSGVERRKSSSLFVRTVPGFLYAVVAQLVECHLAKVDVAGPSPVYRSTRGCSSMVELQPSKLVTWVRFPSPAREKTSDAMHRMFSYSLWHLIQYISGGYASFCSAFGRSNQKVVPFPSSLWTPKSAPCFSRMPRQMFRPRPLPITARRWFSRLR